MTGTERNLHGADLFDVLQFCGTESNCRKYKVRHRENGELYTMEVVPQNHSGNVDDSGTLQSFSNSKISPYLVDIAYTFDTESKKYFILNYIDSTKSLTNFIEKTGRVKIDSIAHIIAETANGLSNLHSRGGIYSALNGRNVLFSTSGHVKLYRSVIYNLMWGETEREDLRLVGCSMNTKELSQEMDLLFRKDWKLLGLLFLFLLTGSSVADSEMTNEQAIQLIETRYLDETELLTPWQEAVEVFNLLWQWESKADFARLKRLAFFELIDWEKVETCDLTPPKHLLEWCDDTSATDTNSNKKGTKTNTGNRLRHTINLPIERTSFASTLPLIIQIPNSAESDKSGSKANSELDVSQKKASSESSISNDNEVCLDREAVLGRLLSQLRSTKQYLEQSRRHGSRTHVGSKVPLPFGLSRSHTHIGSFKCTEPEKTEEICGPKEDLKPVDALITPEIRREKIVPLTDDGKEATTYAADTEHHSFAHSRPSFTRSYSDLDSFFAQRHLLRAEADNEIDSIRDPDESYRKTPLERAKEILLESAIERKKKSDADNMSLVTKRYAQLGLRSTEYDDLYSNSNYDSIVMASYGRLSKSAENLLEDLRKANRSSSKLSAIKGGKPSAVGHGGDNYKAIEELHGKDTFTTTTINPHDLNDNFKYEPPYKAYQIRTDRTSRSYVEKVKDSERYRDAASRSSRSKNKLRSTSAVPREKRSSHRYVSTPDLSSDSDHSASHNSIQRTLSSGNEDSKPEVRKGSSRGRSKIPIKRSKEFEILPSKQKLKTSASKQDEPKRDEKRKDSEKERVETIPVKEDTSANGDRAHAYTKHHSLVSKTTDLLESPDMPTSGMNRRDVEQAESKGNKKDKNQRQSQSYVEVEPITETLSDEVFLDRKPDERDEFAILERASREFEHDKETLLRILRKYNVNMGQNTSENNPMMALKSKRPSEKRQSRQRSMSDSRDSRQASKQESKQESRKKHASKHEAEPKANKGTQVTVLRRYDSSPNILVDGKKCQSGVEHKSSVGTAIGDVTSSSTGRDDSAKEGEKGRKKQVGRSRSLTNTRERVSDSSQEGESSTLIASSPRKAAIKSSLVDEQHRILLNSDEKRKKKVRIDESAKHFNSRSSFYQNKDNNEYDDTTINNNKRGPMKVPRGHKFRRSVSMENLLQGIPETEEGNLISQELGSKKINVNNDQVDNRKPLTYGYHQQDKTGVDKNKNITNQILTKQDRHPSRIPTMRKYTSAEDLRTFRDTETDFKSDDNNNIEKKDQSYTTDNSMIRVSTSSPNISSNIKLKINDYSNENNENPRDTSDLINSLRVLSEKSSSRSVENSPSILRKCKSYGEDIHGFNSLQRSLHDDDDDDEIPKLNFDTLSPRFTGGAPLPSSRTISVGSDSSYLEDEPLADSFTLTGSFNGFQSNDVEARLPRADSYLSVAQNSDDEQATAHNELGRIASFHSLRSVDSGLSDLCNNSGGDEDQREFRNSQVDRSDSGVVKDLEKSLQTVKIESTRSDSAVNVKVWALEDEESSKDRSKRRQSNIEDPVECMSCKRLFPSSKNKGKAEGDGMCPKCYSKRVERKEAIVELIQTEINYGNDLRILKEEFYSPIKNGGILNQENLTSIFLNLQELIDVNAKLCIKLQDELEECGRQNDEDLTGFEVGKLFLDNADFFHAFELFCSKQRQAGELLESLQRKTELLKIFLTVSSNQNTKLRKMDLKSFLTMPVQRIMKYPLLLSRIYRATQRDQPDKEAIRKAQRTIEEQITIINEIAESRPAKLRKTKSSSALNEPDTKDKLVKVCAQILNWKVEDTQIALSGSLEVGLGELIGTVFNRKNLRKLTDIQAVLCIQGASEIFQWDNVAENVMDFKFPPKSDASEAAVILLKRKVGNKYTIYKEPVCLSQSVVCRHEGIPDAFELSPILREPFTFLGNSVECEHWYKCLHFLAKDLGTWRQRRKAMANIMIQSMS